ncbi:MAG: hypothetical protein M3527_01380 [Actinomycetota bacterium]|nr:hypothetical protein [Acidimicrobiia bacterium]MDQ3293093.1 hypothetical protein [Actinomycetota bacterium]
MTIPGPSAAGWVESVGPAGAPIRRFPVGLSAEALALAWARTDQGPAHGAVVVEREVSARGLHGRLWATPAESTLAVSVILRPVLPADEADVVWLAGGLAAVMGAVAAGASPDLATCWPDAVVNIATNEPVAMVKAESQLGPGRVRSAVVTVRFDLRRLGLTGQAEGLLTSVLEAMVAAAADLDEDASGVAALYSARCSLVGSRAKATLLPKGESRGVVRTADRQGRLVLESATGMVERIGIHQLRALEVVP